MRLELRSFPVKKISFSSMSHYEQGTLQISKEELMGIVMADGNFESVRIDLALPGDKVRIVHILDVLDPRTKVAGKGTIYPGFLEPPSPETVGDGITHKMDNIAIINTAIIIKTEELDRGEKDLLRTSERIIDMSGPGAKYSPFSRTYNVVLNYRKKESVSPEDFFASIRLAGLKVSNFLASLTKEAKPSQSTEYSIDEVHPSLPNVGYICQMSSAGFCKDTFLYGADFHGMYPTLIHPNETMDGALVNSGVSQLSNTTYSYCNNPVIRNLYDRHGKDLNFVGIIITKGDAISDFMKRRCAHYSVKLLKLLKADGAILTQERGGNTILDQMLACKFAEEAGIKTAVITYEMGGVEGKDVPLIFVVPEANAITSTGNREEMAVVPRMEKSLGGDKLLYTDIDAAGELEVYAVDFVGSIDQTGLHHMTAQEI